MQPVAAVDERAALLACLRGQRAHVLGVLDGLSDDAPTADVLDLYRHEAALADAVIAATPLDAGPAWWPEELFPDMPPLDPRRTVLRVVTEAAVHAGHLDAVRELVDGRTWLVLT